MDRGMGTYTGIMRMLKRIFISFVIILILISLPACGRVAVDDKTTTTSVKSTTASTTATSSTTLTTGESTTVTTSQVTTTTVTTVPVTTTERTTLQTSIAPNWHAPLDASIFDDAVFVGDSVTNNLRLYLMRQQNKGNYPIGKGQVLCAASLSYTNALWALDRPGNVHPSLNGEKVRVPEGVAMSGAKKVFIMLGMNDFIIYGTNVTVSNAKTLINQIVDRNPDVTIYVQSVTPILYINESGVKTNANVRALNAKLRAMCEENGWIYLDVASVMIDEYGCLKSAYCIDPGVNGMGIHITDSACKAWIDYLRANIIPAQPETTTTTTTTTVTTTITAPEVTTTLSEQETTTTSAQQ